MQLANQDWDLSLVEGITSVLHRETQYFNKMRKDNVTMLKIK